MSPPQTSHSAGIGTYQASVAAGSVTVKIKNKWQVATITRKENRLVTYEVRERYGNEAAVRATAILQNNNKFAKSTAEFDSARPKESAERTHS